MRPSAARDLAASPSRKPCSLPTSRIASFASASMFRNLSSQHLRQPPPQQSAQQTWCQTTTLASCLPINETDATSVAFSCIHCDACSMYRWSLALDLVFLSCCSCAYDFQTDSTQRLAWCVVCLRKFVLRLYFDCHVTCHYNTQGRRLPMPLGSHYRNFIKPCEKKYGVFPVQERKHLYKFWITMAWMKWPYNIISKIG